MRLSQIASSYSFLYRKSGGSSGEEVGIRGEIPQRVASPSLERPREDNQEQPYYINYDGTFYDKHFKPSTTSQSIELKNSKLLRECPQPQDYETYKEYESDLLFWKAQVSLLLDSNHAKLPHVLGLHLFRPTTPQDKPASGEDQESELQASSTKDPWESQLIPEEPNPENYNTYEDYKTALSRWATICSRIPSLPPHASQVSADHLVERCTNVMQSSLPKGTKLYLKKHTEKKL